MCEFICSNPDARELKRALAVKIAIEDYPYSEIVELLGVNKFFVSNWTHRFFEQGLAGIKLGYRGAQSYLTNEQWKEMIEWLRSTNEWNLGEVVTYIEVKYYVIHQSMPSYYALFSDAQISWK